MKRLVCLFLIALFVFAAACGSAPNETKTDPAATAPAETVTAETKETEEKKHSDQNPEIAQPFDAEELKAIPVATAEMTQDQLRDICVRYMVLQASVVWTPDFDLSYECTYAATADRDGHLNLPAIRRYGGQPYSSAARDIWALLDHYDPETGILYASQYGASVGTVIGNNCGTACFWGWSRISSTITFSGTRTMCYNRGCIPLGPYTYDTEKTENFDVITTQMICDSNGEDTMYESYALLQKASGIAMYNAGITGHTRMVKENATVVRDGAGKIDPDQSYVVCVEQGSTQRAETTEENGQVFYIGSRDSKYSFRELFNTGYLPFEVPELCGKAAVQKAKAELISSDQTVASISEGTVEANYCISRVDAIFTDADGKIAYQTNALGSSNATDQYKMKISKVFLLTQLSRRLKKGQSYTLTMTARLGNGETLTFFEGDIQL